MNSNKNIDRLFQEKFKDFEAHPNNHVWEKIADQLNHPKKKRRVLALWWQLGGVAVVLIGLFSIGNLIFNTEVDVPTRDIPIANTEDISPQKKEKIKTSKTIIDNISDKIISKEANNTIVTTTKSIESKTRDSKTSDPKGTTIINSNALKSSLITKSNLNNRFNIAETNKNNSTTKLKRLLKGDPTSQTEQTESNPKGSLNAVAQINSNSNLPKLKKENTNIVKEDKTDKLSITEGITIAKNLEKSINKNLESNKNLKKWQLTPNVAPVFFNTLGNSGSTIGNQFNDNSKTGETNLSYGINAKYAVSRRLKVRTGVNKVNLGFSTNDVLVFNSGISSSAGNFSSFRTNNDSFLRNVELNNTSLGASVISAANDLGAVLAPNVTENNSIDQQFGFIEIPLELEYAVVDRKFGLRFIGGFSAFFLDDNDVFSTIDGQSTLIGEATNINSTSYSANFGLGLNYGFSKAINFNIEPTFKYQLNTFNNVSGDFQPYFIGVYSGFSFKF